MDAFIDLDVDVWDLASAARSLKGQIMNFNEQAKVSASALIKFDFDNRVLHMLVGCTQKQHELTLQRRINSD